MINKKNKKTLEKLGTLGIFLTALIWGYSFVAVKVVVEKVSNILDTAKLLAAFFS